MTDEQRTLLEKFGFRLEAGMVKHPKMGIVRKEEEFARHAAPDELRRFVGELLRNHCKWQKGRKDSRGTD